MKNMICILLTGWILNGDAQIHQMVTAARWGGPQGNGALFTGDSTGHNFQSVYSFDAATGRWPKGQLTVNATGMVYGVTELGGLSDSCVIYGYDLQSNTYTMLHDFYATIGLGWWDQSGPILLSDGNLYGLAQAGGAWQGGAIYRFNPVTQYYEDIFDFDSTTGNISEGGLLHLSNGKLYGMTLEGGTYNKGTIFSFDPIGSTYTVLHHFIDSSGSNPSYGALMQASNNKLYGVTKWGGYYQAGVLFSYDLSTSTYTRLHSFNPFAGADPNNTLVQAANGKLYGLCNDGGLHSNGALFSYDIQTDSFADLHDFDLAHGGRPESYLMLASNGLLYGTASVGGTYGGGVVFTYNIDSNLYHLLYEFDSVNAAFPAGTVLEVNIQVVTGISTAPGNPEFKVMPNPASSAVFIRSLSSITEIKLTDISGRESYVATKEINPYLFEANGLESLANGLYLLKIKCGSLWQTTKLVVQK